MDKFVETVATKKALAVINGSGPGFSFVSIVPDYEGFKGQVGIVIGANWDDRCANRFNKKSLKELINLLQEVHDTL